MSQINPNGQSNNGNYHPKRNVNHRPQNQYNAYSQGYATPETYVAAPGYPPVYPQGAFYSPQYYTQNYVQQPIYRQPYGATHEINLTTQSGEKVDLKSLNVTPKASNPTLNRTSNAPTPKVTPATPQQIHQRTPSITIASPAAASATPASSTTTAATASSTGNKAAVDLKEAFRQQVLARAKAKEAALKSASTPAKDEAKIEPSATTTTKEKPQVEQVKADEVKKEAEQKPQQEAKPKEVSAPQLVPKADVPTPSTKVEEAKVEAKAEESKVEPKAEVPIVAKPSVEQVKDIPEVKSAGEVVEQPKPVQDESENSKEVEQAVETASETKVVKEVKIEEPESKPEDVQTTKEDETSTIKEEDEEADESTTKTSSEESNVFTISKFLHQLDNAKSIEDPFSFSYPEGITGPDAKLKENPKAPKLRYDPIFLIQFADATKLPIDDEFKERIKFITERGDRAISSRGSGFKNFGQGSFPGSQGGFSKSSNNLRKLDSRSNSRQNSKRKGGSGKGDKRFNRNRDREEREPEPPLEPVAPLEKSANRWIPKSRVAKTSEVKYAPDGVTPLLSEEEAQKKTKSLLNKLTLENFDLITDEIIKVANQSQWEENGETLKIVLETTFDKATDEPHWSSMYAQFCLKLVKNILPEVKDASLVLKSGNTLAGSALVRKYLLSKCQLEYEKGWGEGSGVDEEKISLEPGMLTDEYYKAAAIKRRGLGLVRLIGHLYVLGLLSLAVIFVCLERLTADTETPKEEELESLIQLIKTVGQRLDSIDDENSRIRFNRIFAKLQILSNNPKVPSRLQFSFLDLIDLRKLRWQGNEADKGPKTLSEIHEEEAKKHLEEQRNKERQRNSKNDSRSNSQRSTWGRVSDVDIRKVGHVSTSTSSSNLGPVNNFGKSKSLRSRQSSSNVLHSNTSPSSTVQSPNTSSSSPAPSVPSPLSARENSKKQNAFELLEGEGEGEDEDEEEEETSKNEELNTDETTTTTTTSEDLEKPDTASDSTITSTTEETSSTVEEN